MNKKVILAIVAVALLAIVACGAYYLWYRQVVTTYYAVDIEPSSGFSLPEVKVVEVEGLGSDEATLAPIRKNFQSSYNSYLREYEKLLNAPEDFSKPYKLAALETLLGKEKRVVIIKHTRAFKKKVADLLNGDADDIFDALEDMQESGDVESVEIVPIEKVSVD